MHKYGESKTTRIIELWWQLYRTSFPVCDLENFRPMDFCWHECTASSAPRRKAYKGGGRLPSHILAPHQDRREWSDSCNGCFTPEIELPVPITQKGRWAPQPICTVLKRKKKIVTLSKDSMPISRSSCKYLSLYTDWCIPSPSSCGIWFNFIRTLTKRVFRRCKSVGKHQKNT